MTAMWISFAMAGIAGIVVEVATVHPWAMYAAMLVTFFATYPFLRKSRALP